MEVRISNFLGGFLYLSKYLVYFIIFLHVNFVIGSDTYEADYVIITVPLGVLKAGSITFDPPLSKAKQDAIKSAGITCHIINQH